MRYILVWVLLGLLGAIIDLVRHRDDWRAEVGVGLRWSLFELSYVLLTALVFGPALIIGPLLKQALDRKKVRDSPKG